MEKLIMTYHANNGVLFCVGRDKDGKPKTHDQIGFMNPDYKDSDVMAENIADMITRSMQPKEYFIIDMPDGIASGPFSFDESQRQIELISSVKRNGQVIITECSLYDDISNDAEQIDL